jgi:ligand-binding sensor domain-containing protein/serine phosphatase RsbU (regulator of sigma subunit)
MNLIYNILFRILLIIFYLTVAFAAFGQRDAIEFERISVEDGLSQSTVYCILQDHKGFMWFGTEDGLNRYDGYSFKVFNHNPNKKGSLSNSRVISIIEDKQKTIWVATIGGGLDKFDYTTELFTTYRNIPDDPFSLSIDRIMVLCEDPTGKIWVGTAEGGLNLFDPQTEKFKVYQNTLDNPDLLPSNVIRSLFFDSNNTLYVGTNNGLCKYNPKEDNFTAIEVTTADGKQYPVKVIRRFLEDGDGNLWIATDEDGLLRYCSKDNKFSIFRNGKDNSGLASNTIHDLYRDEEGTIWIATFNGLQKYNPSTEQFYTYRHNMADPKSISSNLIRAVYEDRSGVFWIGTYNNGINKFDRKNRKFTVYRNQPGDPLSLPSSTIRAIFEDNEAHIWIGTYGDGLVKFDLQSEGFTHYKHNPAIGNSLVNNYITAIAQDHDNNLWVATNNGLSKYNRANQSFTNIKNVPGDPNSLPDNRLRNLFVDSHNVLWVATLTNGLCKYEPKSKTFVNYVQDVTKPDVTLSQNRVTTIYEDRFKNFWIGTSDEGLNLFDRETGLVRHLKGSVNDSTTISSNRIFCIYQDSFDRLWIGTGGGGLNLYNYDNNTFTSYRVNDGLPNDVVFGILEDNNGYLWLSTNNGLSRFNPNLAEVPRFRNYDKSDGLQNNEFSEGAYLKTKSGLLFFGGINNFNVFDPDQIKDNPFSPSVYITEIRIVNKTAKPGEQVEDIIKLLEINSLELKYYQNNVSILFTGLHYTSPNKNRYKYRLDGFETNWVIPTEKQRFATYTNLKPGKYTFKVIASNPDGIWNETGDALYIIIKPPFWNTWWFFTIAFILVSGIVVGIVFYREASLIRKKKELENMVAIRTSEIMNQNIEIQKQAENLKQANDEIVAASEALSEQYKELQEKNEEILSQRNELENQRNSLANLAWELQEKNEEITAQRNEIEKQKDLLAYQKKEITDSIMYAKRIQQAVLPAQDQIRDLFPEFFIFYRPKSIVSGDFYWATRIGKYRVVASVDCTGHGVPGGFMSMLGVLMLNEVISQRGIIDPAKALNHLRQNIISVLHQTGDIGDTGDGMDLSLCIINDDDSSLLYSGANSSILILNTESDGSHTINEIHSDRMPISYYLIMKTFTYEKVMLKENSILYLFSDGIIDQFGGESEKKLQLSGLKNFILDNVNLPLESQGIVLEQFFDKWKGNSYQVDDVQVIGLKV